MVQIGAVAVSVPCGWLAGCMWGSGGNAVRIAMFSAAFMLSMLVTTDVRYLQALVAGIAIGALLHLAFVGHASRGLRSVDIANGRK